MFAIGEEIKDNQVELGVYFYPKGCRARSAARCCACSTCAAARSSTSRRTRSAMTQNFYVMQAPARLENFQPHMHMRGKAMSLEAIYPDGRKEVLSAVNNFQWNWHVNYVYADHAAPLLPKGTMLVFTAWHDNTAGQSRTTPTRASGWAGVIARWTKWRTSGWT